MINFFLNNRGQDELATNVVIVNNEGKWIEQFSELMSEQEPERLSTYVQLVDVQHLPYLLNICRKCSIIEAEAAILERQGDVTAAYDLLLGRLQNSIKELFLRPDSWTNFQAASQSVIDFCQRQASSLTETEREKVWLTLLDELLLPQRNIKNSPDAATIISGFIIVFYVVCYSSIKSSCFM